MQCTANQVTNKCKTRKSKEKSSRQTLMNTGKAGYASIPVSMAERAQWSPLGGLQTHPGTCSTAAGAHLLGHHHRTRNVHCLGGSICRESPVPGCVVLRKCTGLKHFVKTTVAVSRNINNASITFQKYLSMTDDSEMMCRAVHTTEKYTCHTLSGNSSSNLARQETKPALVWGRPHVVYRKYTCLQCTQP